MMAANVRELLEEIVWGAGKAADVREKTQEVCWQHVYPMLNPGKVIRELEEWACQQGKKHGDTWVKIMRIHYVNGYQDGIQGLENHHRDISNRYYDVASGMRAVLYGI